MAEITLDTSGYVEGRPQGVRTKRWHWSDLTPFQQGYAAEVIKAAQDAHDREMMSDLDGPEYRLGFTSLSPAAIAMIIRDCEDANHTFNGARDAGGGRAFWAWRKTGQSVAFPPVTITLSDDGNVNLQPVET